MVSRRGAGKTTRNVIILGKGAEVSVKMSSAYDVKRLLLSPYIWYMRRKEKNTTGIIKSFLENYYYKPAIYRFLRARFQQADLERAAPNVNADSIVFDVGAFNGNWADDVFRRYGANIHCFEIEPDMSRLIAERFKGESKIKCHDYGLGKANAVLPLLKNGLGSSLYAEQGAPGDRQETVDAVVRDIAEVMAESSQIDWMKINIEGAEFDLLDRMIEKGCIANVVCFNIQFHEWFDGAHNRRRRIRNELKKTHRLMWDYPFIWEQWLRK